MRYNSKKDELVGLMVMEFQLKNSQLQVVSVKKYDIFMRDIKAESREVWSVSFCTAALLKIVI